METSISVRKNVHVTYADFNKHVALYCKVMNKTVSEVIKNQSRLFCQDMCDYTPPFSGSQPAVSKGGEGGFGNKARDKGKAAVSRDVRKIFAPLAQAPAASVVNQGNVGIMNAWINEKLKLPNPHEPSMIFWIHEVRGGFIGTGEMERFKQMVQGKPSPNIKFIMGTTEAYVKKIHEFRRGEPSYNVGKTEKYGKRYVDDWNVVERYIKRVQGRVGKLKSGWYFAGKKLGGIKSSSWIEGQGASTSICVPSLSGSKPSVEVGSTIGRNYVKGYHFMKMAMNHRAYAMRVQMFERLKSPKFRGTLEQVANRLPMGFNQIKTDS